jgi:hypothetical protein
MPWLYESIVSSAASIRSNIRSSSSPRRSTWVRSMPYRSPTKRSSSRPVSLAYKLGVSGT